jgi:hypothetical protein
VLRHHYVAEDTAQLDRILGRQYHAVVGNPPYITPKDAAMRDAYREIYVSCHMKYGLGAPFTERFFDLALAGTSGRSAGFVGLIVSNNFMKREFGSKLIEEVLPRLDLTHVVDCSGAYIPGHGTPTAILFGRNRGPVQSVVRTVRGIRGEPSAPEDPARGVVWSAIVAQDEDVRSTSEFVSIEDTPRQALATHPWNMGGGGAAELQEQIEGFISIRLEEKIAVRRGTREIGFASFPGADDVFIAPFGAFGRAGIDASVIRPAILGDQVRDWCVTRSDFGFVPYDNDQELVPLESLGAGARLLWTFRTPLARIVSFGGKTRRDLGEPWWGWYRWVGDRYRAPLSITFGEVATHNHFVLDRGGSVFKQTAPVIKLPAGATEEDHVGLLGLLNSSTACFWFQQVCHNKGGPGGGSSKDEKWHDFYQLNGTAVGKMPLAPNAPVALARALDAGASRYVATLPANVCMRAVPTRATLDAARLDAHAARAEMIALQEELDWTCYGLYGLLDDPPLHAHPPQLAIGERAFEIALARRIADGIEET